MTILHEIILLQYSNETLFASSLTKRWTISRNLSELFLYDDNTGTEMPIIQRLAKRCDAVIYQVAPQCETFLFISLFFHIKFFKHEYIHCSGPAVNV